MTAHAASAVNTISTWTTSRCRHGSRAARRAPMPIATTAAARTLPDVVPMVAGIAHVEHQRHGDRDARDEVHDEQHTYRL